MRPRGYPHRDIPADGVAVDESGEVVGSQSAAVVVDHVLDEPQGRLLIVVGHRARLRLAQRDGAVAVGRVGRRVTRHRRLHDVVAARRSHVLGLPRRFRSGPRITAGEGRRPGDRTGEGAGDRTPAVVVYHVLDDDQLRGLVVVGYRTRLGLAQRDRPGAVRRVAHRV